MSTPLDVVLREGPRPGSRVSPGRHQDRQMQCYNPQPGKSVCVYAEGPKDVQIETVILPLARAYARDALSPAPLDQNVLLRWADYVVQSIRDRRPDFVGYLEMMRAAIWKDIAYNDDAPGTDTVKMPHALLSDGEGDCVSLTIAMTALARFMFDRNLNVVWRIGGGEDPTQPGGIDRNQHIWPVFDRVPVELTVKIPVGAELPFDTIREVSP